MNNDLGEAHPHSGFSSTWFLVELELENVFEELGKPEYPEKNLSKQRREPTTNSTQAGILTTALSLLPEPQTF